MYTCVWNVCVCLFVYMYVCVYCKERGGVCKCMPISVRVYLCVLITIPMCVRAYNFSYVHMSTYNYSYVYMHSYKYQLLCV